MGLIGDRKSKKQKEKEKEIEKLKNAQNKMAKSPLKKGLVAPVGGLMRYPAGYYTTPAHQSWAQHAGQPRQQPNVNPRYQTWVAPRKQPHLNQLVSCTPLKHPFCNASPFLHLYIVEKNPLGRRCSGYSNEQSSHELWVFLTMC